MMAARAEAARILRAMWWPGGAAPDWSMGRDLAIWKKLVALDGPEVVNGAMGELFNVAPNLTKPCHLKLFQGALYPRCKARWLERNSSPRAEALTAIPAVQIAGIPKAHDKRVELERARSDGLHRLAKARRQHLNAVATP